MTDESKNNFGISKEEIGHILDLYFSKKFDEDIENVKSLGGIDSLAKNVGVNLSDGLNSNNEKDLDARRNYYDDNKRDVEEMPHFCEFVWEALQDTVLIILIVSAIVQIGIGASPLSENPRKDWIDGLAIVFAIVVVVTTTSITNYSKEKKFQEMTATASQLNQIIVRRNKTEIHVNSEEILVGDIVKLEYGMIIPADGIVINGNALMIDESSLTGESDLVSKMNNDECLESKQKLQSSVVSNKGNNARHLVPSSLVFSGSIVYSGNGWYLVLAVGKNSTAGKINQSIKQAHSEGETKTPLELKLEDIADDIGKFGLIAAILTFVALSVKLIYTRLQEAEFQFIHAEHDSNVTSHYTNNTNGTLYHNSTTVHHTAHSIFNGISKEIITIVILCITILVVAIPEGLPLAVTLSLSFSVRKMMYDNNLVRRMSACETMGGANYICTDKTGTLTKNNMEVILFFDNKNSINMRNPGAKKTKNVFELENGLEFKMNEDYQEMLVQHIVSNIDITLGENAEVKGGSKTDIAFFKLVQQMGFDFVSLRKTYLRDVNKVVRIPFNSERKKLSTFIPLEKGKVRIHMKGATEVILRSCSNFLNQSKNKSELTESISKSIKDSINMYENQCLRCISLAYKDISEAQFEEYKKSLNTSLEDSGFTLIGIAGIQDRLKDGIENAVNNCTQAGINVIMITGDNIDTAISIARQSNIIRNNDFTALEGPSFFNQIEGIYCVSCKEQTNICNCPKNEKEAEERNLDPEKIKKEKIRNISNFRNIVKNLKVIARARPLDKYALVLGLRELDNVVAVTGDGTNDAPALSRADVGFAMGIAGTDAAKSAADIIILDDNFTSIISAVVWGRNIYDNIRKFIQFQLSVNLSSVCLVFICSWIGSESPISSIQMLWINLIMDSLGSLALATESPNMGVLKRRPYQKREYIISPLMWKHIIFQAITQFSIVLVLYLYAPYFIAEDNPQIVSVIKSLENCFLDVPGEKLQSLGNGTYNYFVLDGKKSAWSPLIKVQRNVSADLCLFNNRTLFDGKTKDKVLNLYAAFRWYNQEYGNSVHMTIVFNVFVFYALFNQINSRIIDDSFNILKRIHENLLFLTIIIGEIICQFIMTQYGGIMFKCSIHGLTTRQWMYCIGLSSITFVISFILKLFNIDKLLVKSKFLKKYICCCFYKDENEMFEQFIDEENTYQESKVNLSKREDIEMKFR